MDHKHLFKCSELTYRVVVRLRSGSPGQVVTWEELSEVLGTDAQGPGGRHHVQSARRILERENVFYDSVRGVGVKWLEDRDVVHVPGGHLGKVHRAARRGLRRGECFQNKGALEFNDYCLHSLQMNALSDIGRQSGKALRPKGQPLDLANYPPLFGGPTPQ